MIDIFFALIYIKVPPLSPTKKGGSKIVRGGKGNPPIPSLYWTRFYTLAIFNGGDIASPWSVGPVSYVTSSVKISSQTGGGICVTLTHF